MPECIVEIIVTSFFASNDEVLTEGKAQKHKISSKKTHNHYFVGFSVLVF